jgi:colicin import membrane protein
MTHKPFAVHAAAALCTWLLAASVHAQAVASGKEPQDSPAATAAASAAAQRTVEHERIRREREALRIQRQQDESACYQRFAVEDCLRRVRAGVRDAEARLRLQEIELNDAERKEKAAERLKIIEERQRAAPAPLPAASDGAALRSGPRSAKAEVGTQRDQDAAKRAQEQRSRAQKQNQEQATRTTENARRAAEARERHARTLQAAEERRARVEKSRAEAQAQGRVPAAPLPPASTVR